MFGKTRAFAAIILFLLAAAFAQNADKQNYTLYYYGVVTNVNDQNMLNITQDLFAAQIRGIDYVSMQDRRGDEIKNSYSAVSSDVSGTNFFGLVQNRANLSEAGIVFYTRIYRAQSDEKWECTFFAKNTASGVVASRSRQYDSYYKILTDAKVLILEAVAQASGNKSADSGASQTVSQSRPAIKSLDAESVAGTWGGEKDISKIILMRSGRGFIVFTNGATMNINVAFSNEDGSQKLRIVQQDKFNASYYPDIDRKTILSYADGSEPIEWNLTLTPNGTLEGTKKTLVASSGRVTPANIKVVWTKK